MAFPLSTILSISFMAFWIFFTSRILLASPDTDIPDKTLSTWNCANLFPSMEVEVWAIRAIACLLRWASFSGKTFERSTTALISAISEMAVSILGVTEHLGLNMVYILYHTPRNNRADYRALR